MPLAVFFYADIIFGGRRYLEKAVFRGVFASAFVCGLSPGFDDNRYAPKGARSAIEKQPYFLRALLQILKRQSPTLLDTAFPIMV